MTWIQRTTSHISCFTGSWFPISCCVSVYRSSWWIAPNCLRRNTELLMSWPTFPIDLQMYSWGKIFNHYNTTIQLSHTWSWLMHAKVMPTPSGLDLGFCKEGRDKKENDKFCQQCFSTSVFVKRRNDSLRTTPNTYYRAPHNPLHPLKVTQTVQ